MFGDDMNMEYMWGGRLNQPFWPGRIQEDVLERNSAYLYEMYPQEAKIIRRFVDEALDMEDYRGSFIYDEYPDKFLFLRMVRKIADRYTNEFGKKEEGTDLAKNWVMEIVQVVLANEIYRRRNRRHYW